MNPTGPGQTADRLGYVGRIPVRNLWVLMLYANQLHESGISPQSLEDQPDEIPDLVAEILCGAFERRLHRGLVPGYIPVHRDLNRIRGRIDLLDTQRRNLLDRGRVACRYEELTTDTPRYRHGAAALVVLKSLVRPPLARKCQDVILRLGHAGIHPRRATEAELLRDPVQRHDRDGQIILTTSRLAFQLALPCEAAGSVPIPQPDREETWVRKLFEKAIGGFCQHHLRPRGYEIECGKRHRWPTGTLTPGLSEILPTMMTDILLHHPQTQRTLIIETKFTAPLATGNYRESVLKSGHLYQLFTYLNTLPTRCGYRTHAGLLLYPTINQPIDEQTRLTHFPVRISSVDLAVPTRQLIHQLSTVLTGAIESQD